MTTQILTATKDDPMHTTITAQQGGNVGVKDMRFGGVRRLAVRTPGTEGAAGIGSLYLTGDECHDVCAALLRPTRVPATTPNYRIVHTYATPKGDAVEVATAVGHESAAATIDQMMYHPGGGDGTTLTITVALVDP